MPLDPATFAAASGIVGVAVGALSTAALTDWTARRREDRIERRSQQTADAVRQLEALRQTGRRARDVVRQLKVLAVKPVAWDGTDTFEGANDALIGNAGVIHAYRELLVDLQTRFGRGLPVEISRRAARVLGEIDRAISAQEARVRAGEQSIVVGSDLAEELFDLDAFSTRLLTVNQPPAIQGLLARGYIDALRLAAALRLRMHPVQPPTSAVAPTDRGTPS